MQMILDVIFFTTGFGACWLCKDPVLRLVRGTDALIESLELKLAALRARS